MDEIRDAVLSGFDDGYKLAYYEAFSAEMKEGMKRLHASLTAAQARIEKLERMVVWMANSGISFTEIPGEVAWFSEEADTMIYIPCDGTAPSILAAVEKAMQKP